MKEKKQLKISLGTAVFIAVIVIAIIVALVAYILINNNEKENTTTNNTNSIENTENAENVDSEIGDDYFILYRGYEMEKKEGIQYLEDMDYTKENEEKYNIEYYNYENGKYKGKIEGQVEPTYGYNDNGYEGVCIVDNVRRIAISKNINAMPRKATRENMIPEELKDMLDYQVVEVDSIDLDGDGTQEHIVTWRVLYSEGEIGDGKPQESSGAMLFDSNYKKVADLVTLEDGFWGNGLQSYEEGMITADQLEQYRNYIDINEIEYIDIDNDGIMEIIIRVPVYEGIEIDVVKYENGTVKGETDYQATMQA